MNTERGTLSPAPANSGFTLLEVMVAVAIIAIVLVSIMRLQGQTVDMNESLRFYTQAPMLANARMEEIITDPEDSGGTASGDFGEAFSGYALQVDREPIKIDVSEGDEIALERIDVLVLYDNGRMKYRLRHFLATDPGE